MRRKHSLAIAAVSFATLMGLSATTQALTPPASNLGTLRPQDQWKVGTVDAASGSAYCAMVGNFDKQVVLAFARNPDGLGSVALDFRNNFFEAGAEYEVSLKTQGIRSRTLVGRASSEKSVVVQIGQDDAFFDALGRDGALDIAMPSVDVTFALKKFASSYKNLVECSAGLDAASIGNAPKQASANRVTDVEDASLAPIDMEVEKLASEKSNINTAAKEAQLLEKNLQSKTNSFDDMEDQLEREAVAEQTKSKKTLAALDERKQDLTETIAARQQEVAELQQVKEKTERKLLGGLGRGLSVAAADTTASSVAVTGVAAQAIEQQQIAAAKTWQDSETSKKIAVLEAQKNKEADQFLTDFRARQEKLAEKSNSLQKQSASLEESKTASSDRAVKASIVAKQAEIASVNAERAKQSEDLAKKLAGAQEDYKARIAALESERDGLKTKLAEVTATNLNKSVEPAAGESFGDMSAKLAVAEKERSALAVRLASAEKQNQLLHASLSNAEKEQQAKNDLGNTVASLQQKLAEKTTQFDALQKQVDAQRAELALNDAGKATANVELTNRLAVIANELSTKQTQVAGLQDQLKKLDADKVAAQVVADKSSADLTAARAEIAALKSGLGNDQQRLSSLQESLNKQKAELDSKAANLSAEAARLQTEREQLAQLKTTAEKEVADATATRQKLAGISGGGATTGKMVSELEQKRADLDRQAKAQAEQAQWIEREKSRLAQAGTGVATGRPVDALLASERAELSESRSKIKELEQRLGQSTQSSLSAVVPAVMAAPVAAVKGDDLSWHSTSTDIAPVKLADAKEVVADEEVDEEAKWIVAQTQIEKAKKAEQKLATIAVPVVEAPVAVVAAPVVTAPVVERVALASTSDLPVVEKTAAPVETKVAVKKDDRSFAQKWFGGSKGYSNPEVKTKSEKAEKIDMANNFAVPAVPSAPVFAEEIAAIEPAAAPSTPAFVTPAVVTPDVPVVVPSASVAASNNRAAAFLDKVMTYHRPGSKAVPAKMETSDEFAVAEDPTFTLGADDMAPIGQKSAAKKVAADLTGIEAASGGPSTAPIKSSPWVGSGYVAPKAASQSPAKHLTQEMADAHSTVEVRTIAAPVVAVPAAPKSVAVSTPVSIEALLKKSGVAGLQFQPAGAGDGEFVRQWTTGNINGMLELTPSTSRDFDGEVQAYLDRYREDCPGDLQVSVGASDATAGGTVAVADVSCTQANNTYTTSFVFVENANGFGSILHTGYPTDAAKIRSIGDNVAYALSTTGGIAAEGVSFKKAEAVISATPSFKLNVPKEQPAANDSVPDDFETVVIQ